MSHILREPLFLADATLYTKSVNTDMVKQRASLRRAQSVSGERTLDDLLNRKPGVFSVPGGRGAM